MYNLPNVTLASRSSKQAKIVNHQSSCKMSGFQGKINADRSGSTTSQNARSSRFTRQSIDRPLRQRNTFN